MKKYPSLINHYQEKQLNFFFELFPEISNSIFCALEKIDGSNISFIFEPNKDFRIASRNQIVDNSWNKVDELFHVDIFKKFISYFSNLSIEKNETIQVYGEVFSSKIQKRLNYGELKIRFFDVRIGSIILPYCEVTKLFNIAKISNLLVKTILVGDLNDCLNFNVETFKSEFTDEIAEGIVIKPMFTNIVSPVGEIFYLKKKSKRFIEKEVKPKKIKETDDKIVYYKGLFKDYINENRVLSIFSKEGEIQSNKEIGKYIPLIINDAKEDFLKDYEEVIKLDNNQQKEIFKAGHLVLPILQNYL